MDDPGPMPGVIPGLMRFDVVDGGDGGGSGGSAGGRKAGTIGSGSWPNYVVVSMDLLGLEALWSIALEVRRGGGKGGVCTHVMHGRNGMTIDPRIPTMPGQTTLPTRLTLLAASAKRREVLGEPYEG